jgi:hypothetical protein
MLCRPGFKAETSSTGHAVHAASYKIYTYTKGSYPRVMQPECGVGHALQPSSASVNNEWYLGTGTIYL